MSVFNEWPHHWFGFWKKDYKLVQIESAYLTYVDPSYRYDDLDKLLSYLVDCRRIIVACGSAECPVLTCSGKMLDHRGNYIPYTPRTDGVWLWPADLVHYILVHNVRIPDAMLDHIKSQDYIPPIISDEDFDTVALAQDWPFEPMYLKRIRERVAAAHA